MTRRASSPDDRSETADNTKSGALSVVISLLATLLIYTTAMGQVGQEGLRCDDLSSCRPGAGCSGPGSVEACKITCDTGPVIYCGYRESCGDCLRATSTASVTGVLASMVRSAREEQRSVLRTLARVWSKIDPKRSQLLLKLAGELNLTMAIQSPFKGVP